MSRFIPFDRLTAHNPPGNGFADIPQIVNADNVRTIESHSYTPRGVCSDSQAYCEQAIVFPIARYTIGTIDPIDLRQLTRLKQPEKR